MRMMLNANDDYSNLIQKLMDVINKVAPVKNKRNTFCSPQYQ